MIPTTPGYYYWRAGTKSPWFLMLVWMAPEVSAKQPHLLWATKGGGAARGSAPVEELAEQGQWGPAIPAPPTEPPGLGLVHDTGEANVPLEWALVWVAVRAQPPKEDAP